MTCRVVGWSGAPNAFADALASDGARLFAAVGSAVGELDAAGNALRLFALGARGLVRCLRLVGETLYFGTDAGEVGRLQLETGDVALEQFCHAPIACIESLAESLVVGSEASLCVYDWERRRALCRLDFGSKLVEAICAVTLGERQLLFLALCDFRVHLYELRAEELCYLCSAVGHEDKVKAFAARRVDGGALVASGALDGGVRLWRVAGAALALESVVAQHSAAVTAVRWAGEALAFAGSDGAVVLFEERGGQWHSAARLGQQSGARNALFCLCAAVPRRLFAVGFGGAMYAWECGAEGWTAVSCLAGHAGPVNDLCWDSSGRFLLSAGDDKTVRALLGTADGWRELGRPQIHGHAINSICLLPRGAVCDALVCGADEKVVRILEPGAHFANFANALAGADLRLAFPSAEEEARQTVCAAPRQYVAASEGGAPALGLSARARTGDAADYARAPTEHFLATHSLWLELGKLYGHGNELSRVACSADGTLVSACRAQDRRHAALLFWRVAECRLEYGAEAHESTALALRFAGARLLSAGRDRRLVLWERGGDGRFAPTAAVRAHAKQIAAVAASADGGAALSVSRDRRAKLWAVGAGALTERAAVELPAAARAAEFVREGIWIVGMESGALALLVESEGKLEVVLDASLPVHSAAVCAIARRPSVGGAAVLASGGKDGIVIVFEVN